MKLVGPKGRVIHIAHSQGALITSLAVKRLTQEEMKQIEVICFGGAEALECSDQFPFARCINYYSVNDPLLFVVPNAAKVCMVVWLYGWLYVCMVVCMYGCMDVWMYVYMEHHGTKQQFVHV